MSSPASTDCVVVPALGPDSPRVKLLLKLGQREQTFDFTGRPAAVIGSRRDCPIPIEHPDVSKLHCAVLNTGADVLLCDLQSRTGTSCNGEPVKVRALSSGDKIQVGDALIEVTIERPAGCKPSANPLEAKPPLELANANRQWRLDRAVTLIGRRANCDICLDDPDVSLAHALVFPIGSLRVVCDLGSRGGTFVNDEPVAIAYVSQGDVLRMGGESFTVGWPGAAPPKRSVPIKNSAVPAGVPAPAAPPVFAADMAETDLREIEQTINALQAAVSHSKRRADDQAEQIRRREAQIEALQAELAQRRNALGSEEETIQRRVTELEDQQKFLEARWRELEEARGAFEARQQQFEQDTAGLEQRKRELEQREKRFAAAEQAVAERRKEIESLKAEVERQKQEFEKRKAVLARTEKEQSEASVSLQHQAEELAATRKELEAARAEVERQQAELSSLKAALESEQPRLNASKAELDTQKAQLERRKSETEKQAAEQQAALRAVLAREQECAKRETDLTNRSRALEQRTKELEEQSAGLEKRAKDLEARNSELEERIEEIEREAAERDALHERLEKAKSALRSATRLFTTDEYANAVSPAAGEPVGAMGGPVPVVSSAGFSGSGADGDEEEEEPAAPAKAAAAINPLVARLSPEQQERFKVLRRMSKRSDEELVQQIMAESGGMVGAGAGGRKGKRGWWS